LYFYVKAYQSGIGTMYEYVCSLVMKWKPRSYGESMFPCTKPILYTQHSTSPLERAVG